MRGFSLRTPSNGHGPPRGTNTNLASVVSARDLSNDFISARVRIFGLRSARSKNDPLRRSNRDVTQRLRKVSMLGRRIMAATAPSSAITKASASERRSAGTVEPSHNTKPRSGRIRSLICVSRRLKLSRRRAAFEAPGKMTYPRHEFCHFLTKGASPLREINSLAEGLAGGGKKLDLFDTSRFCRGIMGKVFPGLLMAVIHERPEHEAAGRQHHRLGDGADNHVIRGEVHNRCGCS